MIKLQNKMDLKYDKTTKENGFKKYMGTCSLSKTITINSKGKSLNLI